MQGAQPPKFEERLTGLLAPDAYVFAIPLALVGGICWGAGYTIAAVSSWALTAFVVSFFRNPEREIPPGDGVVASPADGRIIDVAEIEVAPGEKKLRIAIFLSVFNVHVNRAPLAGRVVAIERTGTKFLAAFNPDAEGLNVRLDVTLETASGVRVRFAQITGLIARRIICHTRVGDWLDKGARYGLIRFGSRCDVVLPLGSVPRVAKGERVRGGSSVLAELPR
ncbi:MAG: phosphatidylserine decarboxylase family protein [Deltaproteobacteria bacterium]|nr:phosphatidylserine decarboxylase family protein [Deltaproteobacteria bacterium]